MKFYLLGLALIIAGAIVVGCASISFAILESSINTDGPAVLLIGGIISFVTGILLFIKDSKVQK